MDVYGGGIAVLFIAIAECISLLWIYGETLWLECEDCGCYVSCFGVFIPWIETEDKIFQPSRRLEIYVMVR